MLRSLNPYSGEPLATYASMSSDQVEQILWESDTSQKEWARWSVAMRLERLNGLVSVLQRRRTEAATLITLEMGKLYMESTAEIDKCIALCSHYLEHAEAALAVKHQTSPDGHHGIIHAPLGLILGIMPWNFPFWQAFRFIVPTLLAGNAVALKHASNVTGCALLIADFLKEAGFPEGVMQVLVLPGSQMEQAIQHPAVKGVSLTGSEAVGREVARKAGHRLLPMVLELGGSDPFVVFKDADIEAAIAIAVQSRMQNAGQSCIAAKRFIIHASVYESFKAGILERMRAFKFGNPFDESTTLAPLAMPRFINEVHALVESSQQMGAKVLLGGNLEHVPAGFYPPTVVEDLQMHAPLAQEEVFGPVMSLFTFQRREEAMAMVNGTRFGLGATVFTEDDTTKQYCLNNIESGSVYINGLMRSNPALPFGGVKASGFGRELGTAGLLAFTNEKSFWSNESN